MGLIKKVSIKQIVIFVLIVLAVLVVLFLTQMTSLEVDTARAERVTVREFIIEEAKTRLPDEYIISMPFPGTVLRISWEVGDFIEAGMVLAQIDTYPLEQQIRGLDAAIAQAQAKIIGVDMGKPRTEDIESARMQMLEMQNREEMARKDRNIAEVNLNNAQREYDRIRKLHQQGAISQRAYDEAEGSYKTLVQNHERAALAEDAARKSSITAELTYVRIRDSVDDNEFEREALRAEIQALEAQRNILTQDLGKAEMRSPINGYILEKTIEDSQWLPAGTRLLSLGDTDTVEIESDILSEEIGAVYRGAPVEITGRALGNSTVMGTVERIYPAGFMKVSALGIEQQRVRVIIRFDEEIQGIRPGVSLDVQIVTAESPETIAVPERAVFRRQDQYAVFTVENGRAKLTPVVLGLRNEDWAEIRSGLTEGAEVVLSPSNELDDGVKVKIMK